MGEINWAAFWQMLKPLSDAYTTSLGQSKEPLTGFLGPQRTRSGRPATWMHFGVNLGGLEWLIPLLAPSLSPEDLQAILGDQPLPEEQRRRIEDKAIDFALQYEREHPGTFAKHQSVLEADVDASSPSKNMVVRPLPEVPTRYPQKEQGR